MNSFSFGFKCWLLLISAVLTAAVVHAVIFASDFLNFYLDGELVKNGPFVIENHAGSFELHDKGVYSLRQESSPPGTYTFNLLRPEDVADYESWAKNQKGLAFSELSDAYQAYLKASTVRAIASVTVYIPSPADLPALEQSPQISPPTGMSGGKIGHERFFKVIFNENILEQIRRQDCILH